ncbi:MULTISPECIES: hypothetical protein [Micromonospora]|uniref:Uncharacterized protein n=1 Tax=Micromonospora sp. HUAS YX12 TaxID=3156396 RepID=A0AAU7R4X6_9ACTN
MSENAFVFPAAARANALRLLGSLGETQPDQWVAPGPVFLWLVEEHRDLYVDWEPDMVAELERAVGKRPAWAVQVNYRLSRRQEAVAAIRTLLGRGGVAVDDFVDHVWTVQEVETDSVVRGGRFGEPPVRG